MDKHKRVYDSHPESYHSQAAMGEILTYILHVVVYSLSRIQFFIDPMDCNPPRSSVHGTFQTRILEWVAFPSPGDLPDPGMEPASPALQADSVEPPVGKHIHHNDLPSIIFIFSVNITNSLCHNLLW